MDRYLSGIIAKDLARKYVLLAGPRQVGKTTLARGLPFADMQYLNTDSDDDRRILTKRTWNRRAQLVIFDELHKFPKWKSWLKGIYDKEGIPPSVLVTGSARLDTFRRGGDSLAGRHFLFRLHPLSVRELAQFSPRQALDRLLLRGGFPEPALAEDDGDAARWRRNHLDRILREDLRDLEHVRSIREVELLVDLLRDQVGSPVSFESLSRSLQISPHTVKRWVGLLEALYVIFTVTPYARNIARAVTKQPKIYFFDTGAVRNGDGARLENVVALSLLKHNQFRVDTLGEERRLHYLRDRERREVDFCLTVDNTVERLIEVKTSDLDIKNLRYFSERLQPLLGGICVVKNLAETQTVWTLQIVDVAEALAALDA